MTDAIAGDDDNDDGWDLFFFADGRRTIFWWAVLKAEAPIEPDCLRKLHVESSWERSGDRLSGA